MLSFINILQNIRYNSLTIGLMFRGFVFVFPRWDPGVNDENRSSVSQACRKRRLNERFLGITVKRVAPGRCLDGHVEEHYEMYMALGARP